MAGAVARDACRNDLAALAQERPERTRVLVVDRHLLVGAEPADFPAADAPSARRTGRASFSTHGHLDTLPFGRLEVGRRFLGLDGLRLWRTLQSKRRRRRVLRLLHRDETQDRVHEL